jgi:hypothetical protein
LDFDLSTAVDQANPKTEKGSNKISRSSMRQKKKGGNKMILHQGDSMYFLLYLYASLKRGEGPEQRFRKFWRTGCNHLALAFNCLRSGLRWVIKLLSVFSQIGNHSPNRAQTPLEQARFELLAAYPVDRANPPVSQRIRMLRLQQSILYGRLRPQGLGWSLTRETIYQEEAETEVDPCLCLSGLRR